MDIISMVMVCSLFPDQSIVNAMVLKDHDNPWIVSGKTYPTQKAALEEARTLKAENKPFTIGVMEIPSFWLKGRPYDLNELLRPCKNVVLASQILNKQYYQCHGSMECMLSMYKTGNATSGIRYAKQIIAYAKAHPFERPIISKA